MSLCRKCIEKSQIIEIVNAKFLRFSPKALIKFGNFIKKKKIKFALAIRVYSGAATEIDSGFPSFRKSDIHLSRSMMKAIASLIHVGLNSTDSPFATRKEIIH